MSADGSDDSAKLERFAFFLPDMRGGGAERIALNIIRNFVGRGYEVDLVLVKAGGELLELLPPEVKVFDLKAARFAAALVPFARYLRQRAPHAVQVRMWPLTVIALLGRMLARSPARIVTSDHAFLSRQFGYSSRTLHMLKWTTRWLYPRADVRILVSSGAADDLARLSGLERDSLTVVYNPVPPIPRPAASAEIEALWGESGARIITVGTLKPEKNHKLLISSFALLRQRRPARLMILGEGSLRPQLEAHAAREGVAEDVLLPGFARDPSPHMAAADLFVLSSDYEGFGNVLVEAMHLGLKIVTTDAPSGPAEIVANGRYGKLVPCDDEVALSEAMTAALDEAHNPEAQQARAEELSGPSIFDHYLELMLGAPAEAASRRPAIDPAGSAVPET